MTVVDSEAYAFTAMNGVRMGGQNEPRTSWYSSETVEGEGFFS